MAANFANLDEVVLSLPPIRVATLPSQKIDLLPLPAHPPPLFSRLYCISSTQRPHFDKAHPFPPPNPHRRRLSHHCAIARNSHFPDAVPSPPPPPSPPRQLANCSLQWVTERNGMIARRWLISWRFTYRRQKMRLPE